MSLLETSCPFCKTLIDKAAIVCGSCGAEKAYLGMDNQTYSLPRIRKAKSVAYFFAALFGIPAAGFILTGNGGFFSIVGIILCCIFTKNALTLKKRIGAGPQWYR